MTFYNWILDKIRESQEGHGWVSQNTQQVSCWLSWSVQIGVVSESGVKSSSYLLPWVWSSFFKDPFKGGNKVSVWLWLQHFKYSESLAWICGSTSGICLAIIQKPAGAKTTTKNKRQPWVKRNGWTSTQNSKQRNQAVWTSASSADLWLRGWEDTWLSGWLLGVENRRQKCHLSVVSLQTPEKLQP